MRPQQNRRMRGRNNNNNNNNNNGNNNRRGPNPLSRNYESNGPDVKIRGNAQHIADKYAALARDAQASGDRIMSENYLQHAEHYTRIILAAQAQMPQPVIHEEQHDDENEEQSANQHNDHVEPLGSGPQPEIHDMPAEVVLFDNNSHHDDSHQDTNGHNDGPQKAARQQRRVPRRRLNNKGPETDNLESYEKKSDAVIHIAIAENPTQKLDDSVALTSSENINRIDETSEVKPRRRRTVKSKTVTAE